MESTLGFENYVALIFQAALRTRVVSDGEFSHAKAADKDLVLQYLGGDNEAFQLLMNRYLQPIYHFVHSSIRDEHQAEDITQDVFIKVWKHLKRFDPSKNFKVWIYTIAKHTVFDFLRKKKTVPFSFLSRDEEIYDVPDAEPLPDKVLKSKDSAKVLDAALGKIPAASREVLVLYYQEGFNFREIAEVSRTSENTIKSRHRRALSILKKILKKKDLF